MSLYGIMKAAGKTHPAQYYYCRRILQQCILQGILVSTLESIAVGERNALKNRYKIIFSVSISNGYQNIAYYSYSRAGSNINPSMQ